MHKQHAKEKVKIWQAVMYLSEDVWQDLLDVLDIYFVDESIEGLAQSVPGHALKLGTRLVIGFAHHLWHIYSFCLQALVKERMHQLVTCRNLTCCGCG